MYKESYCIVFKDLLFLLLISPSNSGLPFLLDYKNITDKRWPSTLAG